MYLKWIKLAGFKSFVDPTVINVNRAVNAVVGPNGCGKSNIVDAIRWVVGEISAKQLRGQSMSDVIFAGTNQRKPVSKAAVELVFDNTDGRMGGEYSKFGEISIRREVVRDGASNYFINGTSCRRRDVLDMFMGTGLGPRSYSVIEQGMISNLIEAKPEDLRAHIGEVAGTSKYKERRRETELRIGHTRDNLDRLNDLRDEVDKQLRHLQRQANAAKKFKEYQAEKTELSAQVKAMHWRDISEKLEAQDSEIATFKVEREKVHQELRDLEAATDSLRVEQSDMNDQLQSRQKAFYDLSNRTSQLEQRIRSSESAYSRCTDELVENESAQAEYAELIASYQDKISGFETELQELLPQKNELSGEKERADANLKQSQDAVNEWRQSTDKLQAELMHLRTQQDVCETKIQHFQDQQSSNIQQQQRIVEQLTGLNLDGHESNLAPLQAEVEQATAARNQQVTQQQAIREKQVSLRAELQAARHDHKLLQKELADKERELTTQQARQEAALAKDNSGAKTFIAENNLSNQPRLAETLQVDPKWRSAVEMVLQPQLDAICVEQLMNYSQAIEALSAGQLMLLDKSQHQTSWQPRLPVASLWSKVSSESPLAAWLQGIYAVDSLQQAFELRSSLESHESIVTPDGHWLAADWWRASMQEQASLSVLERKELIADLQSQVESLMAAVAEKEVLVSQAEQNLQDIESQLDALQSELSRLNHALSAAEQALARQQSEWNAIKRQKEQLERDQQQQQQNQEKIESALVENKELLQSVSAKLPALEAENSKQMDLRDQLNQVLASAQQTAARADQRANELNIQVSSCENQLQLLQDSFARDQRRMQTLRDQEEQLQTRIDDLLEAIPTLKQELNDTLEQKEQAELSLREQEEKRNSQNWQRNEQEIQRKECQRKLDSMQEQLTRLQMEREGLSVRQATVVEQLEEAGVHLQSVLQNLPAQLDLNEQEARLEKLTDSIARLGAINMAAIEEFDEAQERQTYLTTQHEDLVESLAMLESAIEKIDRESRMKFKQTYEQIDANFQQLFPKVFGGGSARLELTENDWLTGGVLVKAQPPGKRNTTIHLLSGGEKALTALALVFSMFKLNPAPFCVLDEVDAPLDDLNVGRFSDLVRGMAKDTQFIMISHNKLAIAMADQLLGITMQEAGVSRLVNVDMGEAMEMVEA